MVADIHLFGAAAGSPLSVPTWEKIALSKLGQKTFAGLFWCWYFSLA
jgi:hypothetical protein